MVRPIPVFLFCFPFRYSNVLQSRPDGTMTSTSFPPLFPLLASTTAVATVPDRVVYMMQLDVP